MCLLQNAPKSIMAMAFHPSCDKTIVAADDIFGSIGILNVVRLFDFICVALHFILMPFVVANSCSAVF